MSFKRYPIAEPKGLNIHLYLYDALIASALIGLFVKDFLEEYDDFVQKAKEAYNDKDVSTLRKLKKESNNYEDKFFTYKKSRNWTSKDTTTFVTQTKNLEKYLLNRFYEKTTSSSSSGGKTPPTKR